MSRGVLPELSELYRIIDDAGSLVHSEELARVALEDGTSLPIMSVRIGPDDTSLPTFGLFGGVHGLERIGTHVVLAFLHHLLAMLRWDKHERRRFEQVRLVAIPLVNPAGMLLQRRSNANQVDLMRNAPVEAEVPPAWLVGGHRISPWLPWYRGAEPGEMELEAQTLVSFVQREISGARAGLTVDVHSGFGVQDRLWYPYAKSRRPFPRVREAQALARLFTVSHPNHVYTIEAQSNAYVTHGDLWDHLVDEQVQRVGRSGPTFIPFTLEMGSWMWARKDPRQLLSRLGPFNPFAPHRLARVLRRHLPLLSFLMRATQNHEAWVSP